MSSSSTIVSVDTLASLTSSGGGDAAKPRDDHGGSFVGGDGDWPIHESFDDMGLPDSLLRGIYSHGFERPSPVQSRAIAPMLARRDTIAQAQSGTGKTATYTIGARAQTRP